MVALLPIVSGIGDVVAALRREIGPQLRQELNELIERVENWLDSGESLSDEERIRFLSRLEALEQQAKPGESWETLLLTNFAARLRDLIQIWGDCIALRQDIASGSHHALRWKRFGALGGSLPIHRDYGMALLSGLSVMLATWVGVGLWIATEWQDGGGAAQMAGIVGCIFATMDDPAPAMKKFLGMAVLVIVIAFVVQFAVMPLIDGFVALVLLLGLYFVPVGLLLTTPATMLMGMVLCVNFPYMLMLQSHSSLDFQAFINGNLAMIVGMAISIGTTALVRSVGAEWSVRRIVRAGWADIILAARAATGSDNTRLLHRMLDRCGLVAPRLAAMPATENAAGIDILKDLRNALNTADLQQCRSGLARRSRTAVSRLLNEVADHYRHKMQHVEPDGAALLSSIDNALSALGENRQGPAAGRARMAVVALRYNLFPDASPFTPQEMRLAA
jgi:uncharacterized membrane protein YccC